MKPTIAMVAILLALPASAQEGPFRIQPAPLPGLPVRGIEVEPAQPPREFVPSEEFPVPPEDWGEPGFGREMIMPPMPGRYMLLSAHIQKAGKSVPVVLKLDTQTGEVWQLKLTESKFFVNGKVQVRTRMCFEPVAQNLEPQHGHGEVRRTLPGRPDIDRDELGSDGDDLEEVPSRPRVAPVLPPIRNPR